jgi:dTDP-4-dehydrorhamnose 3,5-epimerase
MSFQSSSIQGVWLFTPQVFEDDRGLFFEAFRPDKCLAETGFDFKVAQVNTSVSKKGTLRGIHFKQNPPGQAKFVSVASGSIIDLAIDLRKSSPTFGQWQAFELSEANKNALLIGYGVGHAFLALEDDTRVTYLCDSVFQPEIEHAINPLAAGINWLELGNAVGVNELLVSDKDKAAPRLEDVGHLLFD